MSGAESTVGMLGAGRASHALVRLQSLGSAALHSRRTVWIAFAVVHLWLAALGLLAHKGYGDVNLYFKWMSNAVKHGEWPVANFTWVYPPLALVPLSVAYMLSAGTAAGYMTAWCLCVTAANAIAVRMLLASDRKPAKEALALKSAESAPDGAATDFEVPPKPRVTQRRLAAFAYLGLVALTGTVGMARIDSLAAPVALMALLAARRTRVGSTLLGTAGAWIKIFPAALVLALFAVTKHRWRDVALPAVVLSALVAAVFWLWGGDPFAFLTVQGDRGLQIEAVLATPLVLWRVVTGSGLGTFDRGLVTYQLNGSVADSISTASTLILVVLVLITVAFLYRARSHAYHALVLGEGALSAAMIIGNKVGSPQFILWLFPFFVTALCFGYLKGHRVVTGLFFLIPLLTQLIYPWFYRSFVHGGVVMAGLFTARNLLVVGLFVWLLRQLWQLGSRTEQGKP